MNQTPQANYTPVVGVKAPNKKLFWISLVVIILVVIGFLSWYFLKGPGKKTATSNWRTYTDSTFKFTVNFPADANVNTREAANFKVAFPKANVTTYLEEINISKDTNTLAETIALAKKGLPTGTAVDSSSDITVSGVPAVKWLISSSTATDHKDIMVFIVRGNLLYEIYSNTLDPDFDTFLSSFKFTQ